MKQIMQRARTQIRKVALVGSGFVIAALTMGMSATTFADSYSNNYSNNDNNNYSDNYGGYGGGYGGYTMSSYSSYNSYDNNYGGYGHDYYNHHRTYSQYRWVWDPCLHRYVLIGWNVYSGRWELVYSSDRYQSHQYTSSDRDGDYWYND